MPFENDDLGIEYIWQGEGLIDIVGGSALPGRRLPPAGKNGDTLHFRIVNLADQSQIEMTSGVWTNATQTLARTTIYYPPSGKVNFDPGDKLVSVVFGIAQAQALIESPAQTGNIASGAVTAHQMYTGSSSFNVAVGGIVDVDFSTLGTTVDFILITDIDTVHVDLTTPVARRNIYIYNNTAEGVGFDVRDASDAVITSNVQYRHIARLGWSGTAWVGKAHQSVLGHELSSHSGVGALAALDEVTAPTHFSAIGTPDATQCLSGANTWVPINPNQVSAGEITSGTGTVIHSYADADIVSFINQHASGAVGVYLPVDGTATGDNVTSITTARAGQTIRVDQNLQLENDVLAGRWWVIKNVHVTNDITLTAEATGQINGASTYVIPKNGGEIVLRCYANAGTAPLCFAEGDGITLDLAGRKLVDAELIDYSETSGFDAGFGGAEIVDFRTGPVHSVILTNHVSSLTIDNVPASGRAGSITFIITHGTGPFTWAHPTGIRWAGGVAPTLSSGVNDVDIITYVTRDGGSIWYGFVGALDIAAP